MLHGVRGGLPLGCFTPLLSKRQRFTWIVDHSSMLKDNDLYRSKAHHLVRKNMVEDIDEKILYKLGEII